MKLLRNFLIAVAALVILSFVTGHGYIWGGMRETYFRGWKNSNIDDIEFRDLRTIAAPATAQPWPEKMKPLDALAPADRQWLEDGLTASFLVIHRDTIRYEQYWQGHDKSTRTNSFSMAKTITALAVGLAADRGLISVDDEVGEHLPRFAGEAGRGVTIEHLLQMRSHIPFGENYKNPFAFMAKAYYRDDVRGLVQPFLPDSEPGSEWKYQGGNTMLLEEILASVSPDGMTLSDWVAEGLWQPMGAEDDAAWGIDPVTGAERCFAQFYATSRDYARFGKLLLDGGAWGDQQLVSRGYIRQLLTPIADATDACDARHYGYQTWLGTTPDGLAFSAFEGHRGQFILSVPALDLVVVRTGYERREGKRDHLPESVFACIDLGRKVASF